MASDFLPQIDPTKCIGCDLCVRACPNEALSLVDSVAAVTRPEACTYTGTCQEICPMEAINLTYEIIFMDTQKDQ